MGKMKLETFRGNVKIQIKQKNTTKLSTQALLIEPYKITERNL